ncbi:MAG: phage integrase SAM-like domain-containing protein [Prevotellaceae bacterium]|nr:phage integrase SAM-like domain-containing protein [Prevotellaceae bacterium]MDY5774007.1 phage integrase SAM-like domain-containing protein [Bacteroidaceae bacterium]
MATLKATVKSKRKDGMYVVYIRFAHNRRVSYLRTSWLVNDKGISRNKKDIIDPIVIQQTSKLIVQYYEQLNRIDTQNWTVKEIVDYIQKGKNGVSFSLYARKHIDKMIARGQERTSRNYKWALNHMERFAETDNIMFSRLTSAFLNRWIESLSETNRCKEQYPVCMREVYKAALKEFNDEELGIVKLKNPWSNVVIPRSDIPEKRAITASMLRKFFNVVPDRSRFTNPLMEVGQDVALISFCMCGLNAVDIFNAQKDQYVNGIFHYERQKTRMSRSDKGYFEVRVPEFLKPTFEKYLSRDKKSPWLFNFHDRLSTSDSFSANVNIGIKQIWEKVDPNYKASLYAFRHSWATIAQNECGATMNEVDFGLNHSINKMAKVYVKVDYTPAWILNEKVIDFIFFTDKESKFVEKEDKTFEKISKYNNVRAEAYVMGKKVCALEDTGFTNVDHVMNKLVTLLPKKIKNARVQFKITNVDKNLSQMYQRLVP